MGYTTDFKGKFNISPPLKPEHRAFLAKFAETRRMQRDGALAEALDDPVREAARLPVGKEGSYFVGGGGSFGQDKDNSILDYNTPPGGQTWNNANRPEWGQPGLWCQWVPSEDGTALEWDGSEKFYEYVPWLQYLIDHFMIRWGYELYGEVKWQGENSNDTGTITVKANEVSHTPLR